MVWVLIRPAIAALQGGVDQPDDVASTVATPPLIDYKQAANFGERLLHPFGALQGVCHILGRHALGPGVRLDDLVLLAQVFLAVLQGDDDGVHVTKGYADMALLTMLSSLISYRCLQRLDVLSHHHHAPICHPACIERATAAAQPAVMTYFSSCQRASRRMRQKGASSRALATNSRTQSPH